MTWKSWLQSATAAGLIMFSSACTAHWVVASQPEPQPSGYAVGDPPPAPVEVIPPRPGVHYVWIKGHWTWRAPVQEYEWAPGHWQYTGQDEYARHEHARDDDDDARRGDRDHDMENVHVYGRPPRDRAERVPPAPGRDYEWVKGRWVWHQNVREYEWERGRWERPARVGRTDEPGRTAHERPANEPGRGANDHESEHNGNGRGAQGQPGDNNGRGAQGHEGDNNGNGRGAQGQPGDSNGRGAQGHQGDNNGNGRGAQGHQGDNNGNGRGAQGHQGDNNGNGRGAQGQPGDSNGRGAQGHQGDNNGNGRGAQNHPTEPQGHAVDTHPMIRPVHPVETPPVNPSVRGTKPVIDNGDPTPIAKHPPNARGNVVVYATRQPPHDRLEKMPQRPAPDFVWIGGHWAWQNSKYVWIAGSWNKPQAGFHSWAPGHWAHEARGWYYVEGHWR